MAFWQWHIITFFSDEIRQNIRVVEAKIDAISSRPIQTGLSVASQCLRALRTTDPRVDKNRIESSNGGLYADSCRWVLENDNYKRWKNERDSRLLHIKGEPGKGKTMLVCGILNDLLSSFGAYFFFQETDVRINNATSALRGLIYMLADQKSELISHVQASYERAGKELFTDRNSWHALQAIFKEILKELEAVDTVIVIDAINECIIDRDKLLELITYCNTNYKVKWIVSSRGWPDIDRYMKRCPNRIRLSLKYNKDSIENAIDKYVNHRVALLAEHQRYEGQTKDSVAKHLLANANGTFLWVSLVCQTLEKIRPSSTIASLNQFPPDLNHLYERMLERVLADDKEDYLREILAVATALFRPVTMSELLTLTDFPPELTNNVAELKNLVRECGGFLSIRDSTIEFVHQSAKEYILQKAEKKVFPKGIHNMHRDIYERLIESLSKTLKKDIFGLDSLNNPAISLNEVRKPNPNPLNGIEYACFYWPRHLAIAIRQSDSEDKALKTLLQFLRKHLLHWIEAMTFFEGIPQAIGRLYELESQPLIRGGSALLRDFVHDAHRFALTFGEMLQKYPLQIYSSGAVFTPTNSILKQTFAEYEPNWVKVRMNAEFEWSENVTRVWSHDSTITAIAYSSDGYHFACGFEDGMLELWNIVSGVMQRRINVASMPDFNCNLRTSARRRSWPRYLHKDKPTTELDLDEEDSDEDDDNISVQSDHGSIGVKQDLAASDVFAAPSSPEPKNMIRTDGEMSITDLAFHEDEGGVIFVIDGRRVGFWNTQTDEVKRQPELDAPSAPLVMSVHGKYMAYGIDSPFVTLYNTEPGAEKRILKGQFDDISLITFSPDGELLASCSRKGLIQVWSASTGLPLGGLDESNEEVAAILIFPDGKRLVSAKRTADGSEVVTMLDLDSGKTYWSLDSDCRGLCLSPDGERFVLVRKGHTLFYNTSDCKVLKDLSDKQDSLCVFSPSGEQLATTDSGGIRLFSIHDTKSLPDMIAPAKLSSVRRTYFSDDSRWLTMESQGMLLETYNTRKNRVQRSERFPDSYISATSEAEPLFAYVTEGSHTVSLLNLKTLSSESKLDLPHSCGKATEMSFSPDGKFLAVGTVDGMLYVWNLTTQDKILDIDDQISTVPVRCLLWSTASTRLAARFDNESVGVWDLDCKRQLLFKIILTLEDDLLCMAFSSDGCRLITTHARIFEIWDVDRGSLITRVLDPRMDADTPKYFSMALSQDCSKLSCASAAGLELWDLPNRTLLHSLDMSLSSFKKMSFCQEDTALRLESGVLDIRVTSAGSSILSLGSKSDIFCTKDWIFRDNRPLMWLPDAYRSAQTKYQNKRLVLHHDSGRIALLEFSCPFRKTTEDESELSSPLSRAMTLGDMEASLASHHALPEDLRHVDLKNHHSMRWTSYNEVGLVR